MTGKINALEQAKNESVSSIVESDATKSSKIRALHALNLDRSTIANLLTNHYGKEVRYQHVRNVLVTKLTGSKEA